MDDLIYIYIYKLIRHYMYLHVLQRIVMLDLISKRPVITLEGHRDFTFSSAWHPDPNSFLFASGNQDSTCRIWVGYLWICIFMTLI